MGERLREKEGGRKRDSKRETEREPREKGNRLITVKHYSEGRGKTHR